MILLKDHNQYYSKNLYTFLNISNLLREVVHYMSYQYIMIWISAVKQLLKITGY